MNDTARVPVYEADLPGEPVRPQLRRRLLGLSYHAFAQCLCFLLAKAGYEDVRLAGRTAWKGRNREGGYDVEAWLPAGVGRRLVVVQAKQFDSLPVFQRSVDELRGTCLRAGAAEALLVTTSTFSPVVRRFESPPGPQVAPVRLLDGEELLDLLLLHRVGVWEEAGTSPAEPRRLGIDYAFFEELSARYAGDSRRHTGRREVPPRERVERPSRWLVTIRVDSPGRPHGKWGGGKGAA